MSTIVPQVFLDTLVGLTEVEVQERCGKAGLKCRRDDRWMTADYRANRVNITVSKDGLVTKAYVG